MSSRGPELQRILFLLNSGSRPTRPTVDGFRGGVDQLCQLPLPRGLEVEPIDVVRVFCDWLRMPGVSESRVLLYLHGGAYVAGSARSHRELAARLGEAAGARVLSVDYRLAPEFPFPAALDDVLAIYRWVLEEEAIDPTQLALVGDSAGGGLAVAAMVAARQAGLPMPAAAACLCPWVDLGGTGASLVDNAATDPMVDPAGLSWAAGLYLAGAPATTPLASPLYADLTGLPPMLIHVTDTEALLDDARRLAARAEGFGVDVTLEIFEDLVHVWHAFGPMLAAARRAVTDAGRFLASHLR